MAFMLVGIAMAKTSVPEPTIPDKEYTGAAQAAEVPESTLYAVTFNEPHTDAGEYEVELELTDPDNYSWSGTYDEWVVVPFRIVQATNSWTTVPSITGWTYGEAAHVPVAGAKFGNVKVVYDGVAADGTEISGATSVTKAGDYEAVFTVAGNGNYTGLTNRVPFSVAKAGVSGGGGSGGGVSMNVSGYEGTYDGQEHSITVEITGDEASSFSVTYALSASGPFSAAKPMFTNVSDVTVWYVLSSPNYATVTNSATVTITQRSVTLTAANISKLYDGTPLALTAEDITASGIVVGESFVYSDFASRTEAGQTPATFSYAAESGTSLGNYAVTVTSGRIITVTKRPVTVTVSGHTATHTYDGTEKTVTGYEITTADTLYDIAADTAFGGVATTNRTDVGKSDMGLVAANFTNNNDCFEVTYAVTDGWVKIEPLDIAAVGDNFVITLGANPKYNGTVQTIPVASVTCGGLPVTYTLAGGNATHAGTYALTVNANGNFTGERSMTWQVLKRAITLTSGGASKVYDGSPLVNPNVTVSGDGFIGIEGATFDVSGSQTVAGTSKNTFTYTLKADTLAGDYDITKVEGDLTVTKATAGSDGGTGGTDEPGGGEVPEGGESKFDVTVTYDGEGHTIDTNTLVAAFGAAMIGESAVAYALDDGSGVGGGRGAPALPWGAVPMYTNVGEYVVWYRVTNSNYEDFVHAAKVTIPNRSVTVTSGDGSWTYDGLAHSNATVTAEGFVVGEGIVAGNFATITDVGSVANSFDYTFADGTLAENYVVTCVTGTLTVTKATYDMAGAKWNYTSEFQYDGSVKTVDVSGLPAGVTVASYTGNTEKLPGIYTAHVEFSYDAANYNEPTLADLTWTITSAEEGKLHDIFDDLPVVIEPDGDGGWKVTLTNDLTGPIDIPDNLGHLTIDLDGHNLIGPDGVQGSETTPGGNGQQAIRIVAGEGDGRVTRISIVTSGDDSLVKGGDGGDGNPGGNGAAAIEVMGGCRDGVKIDVGEGVTVRGGKGGDSVSGNGGDGGAGIVGDVGTNDGTITGGDGGDSDHGHGGDGGQGVTGNVDENNGTISGGRGGGTIDGTPGEDGVPVGGDIGGGTGTINRARVIPPSIAPKEYTGSALTADVPVSPRYSVAFNAGGTAVGSYVVTLELTDPVRYRWPDTDGIATYVPFEITKAAIDVSGIGWDYSAPLPYTAYPQEIRLTNLPDGVTATYTGNRATEAGTYTAHATFIYNTDNYTADTIPDCVWTIKQGVPFDGGNTDDLGGSTINYSGTYDGEAHGISVILRDPRPAGARVRYSMAKDGPFTEENPLFTDACRETVWYLVTADGYEALTNSATVTIDPKPFTASLVKHKGLKEVVEGGTAKIVPTFVIEDSWPCKVTENDWELVDWTPRSAGGGTAVVSGRNNYTGQITVEIGNEMTVLFDAVYGAERESLRVFTTQEPGKPYVFPTEPNYHGHAFLGWFTDRDGGEQIAPGTIVALSDPDTLYAHWTVRTFHISYELNGGTGEVEDFDAEYGSDFGAMPKPNKPGYMFDGWWTTADFQNGTKVSEGDGVPFRDTTLFAKWERRRLWYNDTAFHLEKAAKWDGYMVNPAAGDVVVGTIQVKAGKPNKKTGLSKLTVTVQLSGGKKIKLRGKTFDGTFTGEVNGRALSLRLGYSSLSGTFGGYTLDGSRNVFAAKDAESKIVAAQVQNRWQGTYVVAWPGVAGWNGLSLEVKTKGKVKASGTLADGTKVSATTQLLVGERECAIALSWTKKTASVACLVWLCEDGTLECANLPGGVSALIANARSGAYLQTGAKLHIGTASLSAVVSGLQENLLPDGMEVRMNGTKFDVDKAGRISVKNGAIDLSKAGTNPSGLKLNYKVKDCTFKGSFNGYVLSGGKLKKVRVQVSGVVLGRVGYGTATVKKVGSVPVTISP